MPSPLTESNSSSPVNASGPLTLLTSNPSSTLTKTSFFNERENLPPTPSNTTDSTTTTEPFVIDEALQCLFAPGVAQQSQIDRDRRQAEFKKIGPSQTVKCGFEFDYKANRKRELRVKKMMGHKNSLSPALKEALAEFAHKRADGETREKQMVKREKRREKQIDRDLSSDDEDMFEDDQDLF